MVTVSMLAVRMPSLLSVNLQLFHLFSVEQTGNGAGETLVAFAFTFIFRCLLTSFFSSQAEKVHELNEEIGKLLAKAEQLGAEGNVDESQKILMEVEKVRAKKKEAEVGERSALGQEKSQ